MSTKFAHLHVHSMYSLLDGSSKIDDLIKHTKEMGMDSIALTDHGVMYGVIDFYKKAIAQGVKPIIGSEVYVANTNRFDKEVRNDNFYCHLILLAENNTGYENLVKIVSTGYLDGFYYRPRVDKETLKKYSSGIIALSACLAGPICRGYFKYGYERAIEEARDYKSIFGENNFFIELQDHGISEQKEINPYLIKISQELNIPMVCTNDVHYTYADDAESHEVLLCIQTAKTINDPDRLIYEGGQFYLKSPDEMARLFYSHPEMLVNAAEIADRCNVNFDFNNYKLPKYSIPNNDDAYTYLRSLVYDGLKNKYTNVEDVKERVEYELSVISSMGFVDYFLIVWDFINFSRKNGIAVGPGRGSAAGSIVSYGLSITTIDPIKYNLLFERFLNPERVSMPDIDIDFCYERRQEVIDYVIEKYGKEKVAQIITFGTMQARMAIRDVGRALGLPYSDVDKIAKMIPMELGITIDKALKINSELKEAYENENDTKKLIDMSLKLEGLPRHSSTHAAGVVISDRDITDYVPLYQNDGIITTQFPMTTLEELGLLKMDFLGLRTLTVIQMAVNEINRLHNIDLNIDDINDDDEDVYKLISSGKTDGLFQLESSGMKQFMQELKPESLEEVIAGISLYRPGPMDFIPKYIKGKNNKNIVYLHEKLEPILKDTYGCIVYQEQVMQIVRDLGGYDLGRSDLVRRAMSKKKEDVMIQERKNFIFGTQDVDGCIKRGISEEIGNKIFDEMTDFAKYAFNKSHAAAYALIGYQTAWLKYYYKVEFMTALLSSVMGNNEKISEYIHECKTMDIKVLQPDINESFSKFSVYNKSIRFGLSAVKNVGEKAINQLVKERELNGNFTSLTNFLERLSGEMNKRCVESLIYAGALDSLGGKRNQYLKSFERIMNSISYSKKKNIKGQIDLFSLMENNVMEIEHLEDVEELKEKSRLNKEKEVIGVYLTGHPLNKYTNTLNKKTNILSKDFIYDEDIKINDGQSVTYGGLISGLKKIYTRKNELMGFLNVEDLLGNIEVVIFPNLFTKYREILYEDKVIIIDGTVSLKEGEKGKLIANKIYELRENTSEKTLWLKIDDKDQILEVNNIIQNNKGDTNIIIYKSYSKEKIELSDDFNINHSSEILEKLTKYLGEKNVILK
ncbi:MAG: DNA polymerase III subunit alpha [Lachnospirales bacterium]